MTFIRNFLFLLIPALLLASQAYAHHLWVMKADDGYVIARGILSQRIDAYKPDCVKEVKAYRADGSELAIQRSDEKDRVVFKSETPVAMAAVTSKWGHRVNTTKGKKFMTRKEAQKQGLHVLNAFFSTHYAKSLIHPVSPVGKSVGMKFEIVPLEDPFQAAPGAEIPFKLLFDGKPLAGSSMFTADGQKKQTDESGIARIPMSKNDRLLIYSRHRIDLENQEDLDYLIFTTFLTFEARP